MSLSNNPEIEKGLMSRRLLQTVFLTLSLSVFALIAAFHYFDRLNNGLITEITEKTSTASAITELNKGLFDLEINIRKLMTLVLRNPEMVAARRRQLSADFSRNITLATKTDLGQQTRLVRELQTYQIHFDKLMQDYVDINQTLHRLDEFKDTYTRKLQDMEERTGQLLVDSAVAGQNTEGLQQLYSLIPFCLESFYQAHLKIRSSVASFDPLLLLNPKKSAIDGTTTASDHIENLRKTLHTLTSTELQLSRPANEIIEHLDRYQGDVSKLYQLIVALKFDMQMFEAQGRAVEVVSSDINSAASREIGQMKAMISRHEGQGLKAGVLLICTILTIILVGLILTYRIGRQLKIAALDALRSKDRLQETNIQLQDKIVEIQTMQDALIQARNELEVRVQDRTMELAASNEMLRDEIEERSLIQNTLAAEKERLKVTLHSIGDGVISTDIHGNIVMLNPVAAQLTGCASEEEAAGRPLSEVFNIVNEKTGEPCQNPVEKVLSTGKIVGLANHTVLIAKDGAKRSIADSAAPILDKGAIMGVVLVFRDVTEKIRMEEELVKVEKLESVGVLAGGIAHDFNNILAAILGNINLALYSLSPESDKVSRLLKSAEKASLRAKDLTQQLLTFAKGGAPIKKLANFLEVIRDSSEFALRGSHIKCHYQIPTDLWHLEIDTGQISQVVQNLIINAGHAMPNGGEITITCENFAHNNEQIAGLSPGNYVKTTIADTGVGIPADLIDRVFDPYFTTKETGSGLGLAVTNSIIHKHNGEITVESSSGKGTTFTIYLPAIMDVDVELSPLQLPKTAEAVDESMAAERKKILVMDDEEMLREIAQSMLTHLGYEVTVAKDGKEAIEIYRKGMQEAGEVPPDVVIMDLTIPGGMGGKDAVREILSLDPDGKVIVSSGYSDDPVMANYRDYGFVASVSKPYQLKELQRAIGEAQHMAVNGCGLNQ